jgi:hypothetical protein
MRLLAVAFASSIGCLAACESRTSPIPYIPRPTAATDTSTADFYRPTMVVPPFRRTIVGTVRQVNGAPIAGVQITGYPLSDGVRPRTVTAGDGSFRFDQTLAEGLGFEKEGFHPVGWTMPADTSLQDVQTVAVTFEGGYPFGDEGKGYACSPCKLFSVSGVENGAVLRITWSGSIPLAVWAGEIGYDPPSIVAAGPQGTSELLGTTARRINAILVGLDRTRSNTLSEPVAFTLTVTPR